MNAPLLTTPRVEPFFFDARPGTRFSLYHAPNSQVAPRGAILYVHPFAEELNRTRRMAAQQSRAFAALGYAVLQIDLFGCGDSCGEFNAGRWQIWHDDLALAAEWLAERDSGPLTLWGLRLGGLLALDAAARLRPRCVLLWQPFMSGRACINQFLRLSEQLQDPAPGAPRSTAALRAQLAVHATVLEFLADGARCLCGTGRLQLDDLDQVGDAAQVILLVGLACKALDGHSDRRIWFLLFRC